MSRRVGWALAWGGMLSLAAGAACWGWVRPTWVGVLLCATGSAECVAGLFVMRGAARARARADWLQRFGRIVSTDLQAVALCRAVRVNGRHPYRIVSRWKRASTGRYYTFESGNIWFDPSPYVEGRSIHVRIDPNNPRRYWMDISFLPDRAPEPDGTGGKGHPR